VRLLVDSHVALWALEANPALGPRARSTLEQADEVFFSAVTPWELGIKRALGKVDFPDGLVEALTAAGFTGMPITVAHASLAPVLDPHHRDPFDRMLVAQARLEGLAIVTADGAFEPYGVELVDARR
jgi:PIN domain nuclease of toxin-antitoxin system